MPADIQKISFVITIHEAEARRQNFGQVSNAYVRVINEDSNEELIRYDLGEDFSIETALITGELYRHGGNGSSQRSAQAIKAGWRGSPPISACRSADFEDPDSRRRMASVGPADIFLRR